MIDKNHGVFTPSDILYYSFHLPEKGFVIDTCRVVQIRTTNNMLSLSPLDYEYKVTKDRGIEDQHWIMHSVLCALYSLDRISAAQDEVIRQEENKNKIIQKYEGEIKRANDLVEKALELKSIEEGKAPLF
jgi:hypothetical protein